LLLITLILSVSLSLVHVASATETITLKIEPARVAGRYNKYASFAINITEITETAGYDLKSWSLKVNWTDTKFEYVSAAQGPFLKKDGADTYWVPPIREVSLGNETIQLGCAILGAGIGVRGAGILTTVTINVTDAAAAGSKFDIHAIELRNSLGYPINSTYYDVVVRDELGEFAEALYYDINYPFGMVDIFDLITVGIHYGETGTPGWIDEDIDDDGNVDIQDLAIIAQNYGAYVV